MMENTLNQIANYLLNQSWQIAAVFAAVAVACWILRKSSAHWRYLLWLIVLNVLAIFAVFLPWELGNKADLFAPAPAAIRPEWYFMFMFQTLKIIPAHILFFEGEVIGILGFMLGFLVWLLVPFIDRKDDEDRYRLLKRVGIVVVFFIAAMTAWGYLV